MDYQKAEDSYREILKVDPSRKSAYTGIIQAYYYQGKEEEIEEVINDAEEHISDTEGFDEILYWLKKLLTMQKNIFRIRKDLMKSFIGRKSKGESKRIWTLWQKQKSGYQEVVFR